MLKLMTFVNALTGLILLLLTPAAFSAEDLTPPQLVLQEASDKMLHALNEHEQALDETPEKIFDLVEDILIPHFDFERMARLALGRSWRDATETQQQRFVEAFRRLLVRTYATAILEYSGEEFRFLPFRDDLSRRRVDVPVQVIRPGAPNVPVSISMFQNDAGAWKVYDVKIEGISFVTTYRSSFNRDIRNDGFDHLIQKISQRNQRED